MTNIQRYLEENFGLSLRLSQLGEEDRRRLPLYLKGSYEIQKADFDKVKLLFVRPKGNDYTPSQLEKQQFQLREILNGVIVFVLEDLEPYLRKRLIESRIAFCQTGKQLYIPELLVNLNDLRGKNKAETKKSTLGYTSQCALIYHLLLGSIEDIPLGEVAKLLVTNAMSISRIAKELEQHQIISIEGTKEKQMHFIPATKRKIWEEVQNLMNSPIKKVFYTDFPLGNEPLAIPSYDSALAKYTTLSEGNQPAYAIARNKIDSLDEDKGLELGQYGRSRVELWAYDPAAFSRSRVVDPLSLYLSMRNEEDERIKIALEQMIDNIKW
ncbi:hypothetical protein [Pedobacter nanyangensis]|uniref:hypothetical protein n=1 Tax=Pedobacter nanyangensis TaxID=1562389 RepID=UPI000DE43E73|nr:hypothetical protein [Pedobacter nanyangensis]